MSPTAYVQGYNPVVSNDFSAGLNIRDKADAVSPKEAIDLLNVTFTDRGQMRQRDGLVDLTGSDLSARVTSMSPYLTVGGLNQLIVVLTDGSVSALNSSGSPVSGISGMAGTPCTFARFGSPTAEYIYLANGIDTLRRWDGSAWSDGSIIATLNGTAGVAMPRAGAVAVTAQAPGTTSTSNANNRLVATAFGTNTTGGPGGAPSNPSRVYFSNAGQSNVWETDGAAVGTTVRGRNFIDLTPGDGEQILAAVSWRELTFIFKETKFFVFWGESTNPDGTPSFNYREVVNQVGLRSRLAVVAGRDGVYFTNDRGVYVTTGGEPKLLSDVVKPMWSQDPDVYFKSEPINLAAFDKARAHWHLERFYLAVPTGTRTENDRILSYDVNYNWWTLYDLPASALASFQASTVRELHIAYSAAKPTWPARVGRLPLGTETDRGERITSRWRSGWTDDQQSVQRTQRELKVWGTGAVKVSCYVDFRLTAEDSDEAILGVGGTWPVGGSGTWDAWLATLGGQWPGSRQNSDDLVRVSTRGTVFSTQFENTPTSPIWSVSRFARHIRETRMASVR